MEKIFISGSININDLNYKVLKIIEQFERENCQIYLGDAKGVDFLVQKKLYKDKYFNVIICTIYSNPRNLITDKFKIENITVGSNIKNEREKQTIKDYYMTEKTNFSFVIWDGKSKGSYNNIIRALKLNKKLKVFLDNEKRFLNMSELNKRNINLIYRYNIGYNIKEIINLINEMNIDNIKSRKDLIEFLKCYKIIKSYNNNEIIPDDRYKNYFLYIYVHGKKILRFRYDILNLIKSKYCTLF